jgi:hypothetical protein
MTYMSLVRPSPPCVLWKTILPFGEEALAGALCADARQRGSAAEAASVRTASQRALVLRGKFIESS